MAELRPHLAAIRRAGGDLSIIGTGDPASAKEFQRDLDLGDVRVFTDETRRSHELAGFRRGIWTLLRPRAVGNYLRAFLSGHRWRRKQGDALQQGGVLVVRPDGTIVFRFLSAASGDHPDPDAIVEAVNASYSGDDPSGKRRVTV